MCVCVCVRVCVCVYFSVGKCTELLPQVTGNSTNCLIPSTYMYMYTCMLASYPAVYFFAYVGKARV